MRRLDAVAEKTKAAVMEMKTTLDQEGVANQGQALRQAADLGFYNVSPFTLRELKSRTNQGFGCVGSWGTEAQSARA
jgi:type I restriction enzyme M protein